MTTDEFDALAHRFYRDTGMMAPGKSVPVEMAGMWTDEQRDRTWRDWLSNPAADPAATPHPEGHP